MILAVIGTIVAYLPKVRSKCTGTLDFKMPENTLTGEVAGGTGKSLVTLVYHEFEI